MELCQILNVPIIRQVPNTALILCQPTASGSDMSDIEEYVAWFLIILIYCPLINRGV